MQQRRFGFDAAPDGTTILLVRRKREGSDLIHVDEFR